MTQLLHRIGGFAALHPWRIVAAWLTVAAVVLLASASYGGATSDSMEVPGLDSQQATDLLERAGSGQAGLTAQLVVTPADPQALDDLRDEVLALPHVLGVAEPVTSADGQVALLPIQYPPLEELSAADLTALEEVRDEADTGALQVEMRGDLVFAFTEPETGGEVVGLVAALVILLVAFGSVVAAGIPIGVALVGLATSVGAMTLAARSLDVPTWAPVLGSMVGLGVGIDYALFILTRHREQLAAGVPLRESIARAVSTAGASVVLAGGIVVVSILGLTVAGVPFMTAGAFAVSTIVLVMVLASITLLPALLAVAGNRVNGERGRARRTRSDARWQRRVEHVVARPRLYAGAVLGLLILLAAPAFALRAGIPDDGTLPESRTERRAYDLLADGFGPGVNGQLLVVVDTEGDTSTLGPLRNALAADPGVASVLPATLDGDVATLVVTPTTGPQDEATYATTERLRTEVLPEVLDGAHVGGQTAGFADVGARVNERLPWFVAAVLLLSTLLLAIVFRSVVIPLQAAAMNLLSIGAAYGVLVMVFQWGWAADLIGLESTVPIVSFIPMFMFAVVFGLSMDYEVFLLSRIREEYDATGDTRAAIVHGLARTGRVITSAAFIMISVFLGFVLGEDPATKMFGLGLATAVLVDATLVRMVLLPATMQLCGRWNWWSPGAGRVRAGAPGSLVGS